MGPPRLVSVRLRVPSMSVPSSNPLTKQLLIVTFSAGRATPSPCDDLRQIPSSHGEFTEQFEIRTLLQESTSIPSRFVSIVIPSTITLSHPVARIPKWPP